MKNNTFRFALICMCLLSFEITYARAGGGGNSGGGGGIIALILAPFLLIYGLIISYLLNKKNKKAKQLLQQIAQEDPMWNHRRMKARIEEIYFKVQSAWMERNQDLAKDCMSDRIYLKHKLQTDEMLRNGRKNILAKVNLKDATIFSVSDFQNDDLDTFAAHISGSMIDYEVDDVTGTILSGDSSKIESFTEIWHFIRQNNQWVLDEIDQNASMGDIRKGRLIKEPQTKFRVTSNQRLNRYH